MSLLRVLTYHRIADPDDSPDLDPALVSATPETFRRQMEHLRKRYAPVTLDRVMEACSKEGRPLPDRAVHVTVDDAYRDFAEHAWPVLRDLEIPVTVFVPTAYPDQPNGTLWWDRLHQAKVRGTNNETWTRAMEAARGAMGSATLPDVEDHHDVRHLLRRLGHDAAECFVDTTCREVGLEDGGVPARPSAVLSWNELRALSRDGVSFGAHTRHHAALTRLDEARVRSEIRGSLEDLERELGAGLRPIAYPYGLHDATVVRVAREEGCTLGFTCDDGMNELGDIDPYQLRRTNITLRTSPSVFALRMMPWFAEIDRWRHRSEREPLS